MPGGAASGWPEEIRPLPSDGFDQLLCKVKRAHQVSERMRSIWPGMCDAEGNGVTNPALQSMDFLRAYLDRCFGQPTAKELLVAQVHRMLASEEMQQRWEDMCRFHGKTRVPSGVDEAFLRHFLGSIGQPMEVLVGGPETMLRRVPPPPPPPMRALPPLMVGV